MAEREFCKVEREGRLTIVTINRPEVMNAVTPHANQELCDVFDEFEADKDQWVAIITGAGERAFCAGNDLKFQAGGGEMFRPKMGFGGLTNRFDMVKPVIAAVNGVAMGGGFEIALACDLIIASDNARFALPEPKVGLAAMAGGMHRLPRQIGLKRAMGMMLTARHVPAAEGMALGFVNEVVPQADLMDAARRWAELILECSPMSIKATKKTVIEGLKHADLSEALANQGPGLESLYASKDAVEGPLAFSEKRKPNWTNE